MNLNVFRNLFMFPFKVEWNLILENDTKQTKPKTMKYVGLKQ